MHDGTSKLARKEANRIDKLSYESKVKKIEN